MKKFIAFTALLLLSSTAAQADTSVNGSQITNMSCKVYFSPNGGAQQVIIDAINASKSNIRVAAYELTVQGIADALIAAKNRGVDVRIIVDQGESKVSYSKAQYLANAGISISYDPKVSIHHNKFMVIDDYTLLTGSYNYSGAAETSNAENMLACHTSGGSAIYKQYWTEVFPRTIAIPAQ